MVLSKRERLIALVTLLVVGVFVLNSLVIRPGWRRLQAAESRKLELRAQVVEAQNLFERRRMLEQKWKKMLSDGLRSDADAESRVARALDTWAGDTRLTLTSVKPERVAGDKGLQEMTFVVAGRGRLDAVARFLYDVETAEMPIKVKDMQLGSSGESGDSMSLQLTLSALYLGAAPTSSQEPSKPKQPGVNNEDQLLQ
jgi:Tfp pilus assembly protein PilO